MRLAAVVDGFGEVDAVHAAFLHHAAAGGILFEETGTDGGIAEAEQLLDHGGQCFGGIALIPVVAAQQIRKAAGIGLFVNANQSDDTDEAVLFLPGDAPAIETSCCCRIF